MNGIETWAANGALARSHAQTHGWDHGQRGAAAADSTMLKPSLDDLAAASHNFLNGTRDHW